MQVHDSDYQDSLAEHLNMESASIDNASTFSCASATATAF
jgi:hypothetical protein